MAPSTKEEEITDLYTLSLHRIKLFKRGAAFSEHSPLLHSLSQMPNWVKPHSGLQKMFLGEVVGKRVVVQGLWIGGWCWGPNVPKPTRGVNHNPMGQGSDKNGTKAPWVR
jgi:serine/threonine-protein phosphatase 2A activator